MEHEDHRHGERQLASAVVNQAVADALCERTTDWDAHPDVPTAGVKRAAIAFCILRSGPWAVERERWCSLAEVNPDVLRERVLAQLRARRQAADGPPAATMEPRMTKPRKKPAPAAPVDPVAAAPAPAQPQPPAALIMITFQGDGRPVCQWHNLHPLAVIGAFDMLADEVKASLRPPVPVPAAA